MEEQDSVIQALEAEQQERTASQAQTTAKAKPKTKRRTSQRSQAHRENIAASLRGNQNAAKPDSEKVSERAVLSLSLTERRREQLRLALEWREGYLPEDSQVEEYARQLAYSAWDAAYRQIERDHERAIIL